MVTVFLSSCEKDNANDQKVEKTINDEPIIQELTKENPMLQSLKRSEDVKNFNEDAGELLWEMTSLHTFEDEQTLPVIVVPIEAKEENPTISMLVSVYNEQENKFISIVNDIELAENIELENGYSGEMKYKTVKNEDFLIIKYADGVIVDKTEFEITDLSYRGLDLGCFIRCFIPGALGIAGGGGIPVFCVNAYYSCASFPTYWNPACVSLAGCAAYMTGYAGYCAWACWN